jgi:hypothetical protein
MKYIWLFVIAISLLVMAGGLYLYMEKKHFIAQANLATGKVIAQKEQKASKSGYEYAPTILFTSSQGRQHRFTPENYSKSYDYELGEHVEIYYLPGKPEETEIKSWVQWTPAWGMSFTGFVLLVLGITYLVKSIRAEKLYRWLVEHGKKITTQIHSIQEDPSQRLKEGGTPYVIYTQWTDPQTKGVHIFKSECMWYNPSPFVPPTIEVLVDPANYKRYVVDLTYIFNKYMEFTYGKSKQTV